MKEIYSDHRLTFYCDCDFDENLSVDHQSCGYIPNRDNDRAHRVEWEHIVPAHAFGRSFSAWRDGHPDCVDSKGQQFKGRRCARKVEPEFRKMEADLFNLVPAIGEINGLRSNYTMAMLPGEPREFGACDVEIADRKIEPRPEIRGNIARVYFYMDQHYPGRGIISQRNEPLLEAWSAVDPPDAWEAERARRVSDEIRNRGRSDNSRFIQ